MDAETLYHEPQRKVPQLVEGLLPQGLSILCGASKIGKSWLVLWLCLQITKGEPVWMRESAKCDVLYLCLEDTCVRIQERLHQLTDDPPEGLRFSLLCGRIGDGLEEEIESALARYPGTGLIVIDTLQKIRRDVSGSVNAYSHSICILLVHHQRKLADSCDPMNDVSGRDVEQQELSLRFENMVWQLVESKGQAELSREAVPDFVHQVAAFMEGKSVWTGSMTQLLSEMNIPDLQPSAASRYLSRFCYEALEPSGITYATHRTGKGRTLILKRSDGSDGNDA